MCLPVLSFSPAHLQSPAFFLLRTFRKFPAKTKITKNNHRIWSCSVFVASPDGSSATPTFALPRPPGSFGPSTCPVFSSVLSDKCELPVQSLIFCVLWMSAIFLRVGRKLILPFPQIFQFFALFFVLSIPLCSPLSHFFHFWNPQKRNRKKFYRRWCVLPRVMCSALSRCGQPNTLYQRLFEIIWSWIIVKQFLLF